MSTFNNSFTDALLAELQRFLSRLKSATYLVDFDFILTNSTFHLGKQQWKNY